MFYNINIKYNHTSGYNKFQKQERILKATNLLINKKVPKMYKNATEVEKKDSQSFLKFLILENEYYNKVVKHSMTYLAPSYRKPGARWTSRLSKVPPPRRLSSMIQDILDCNKIQKYTF